MLPGDSFVEPLIRKTVLAPRGFPTRRRDLAPGRVTGPADASVLVVQKQVIAMLRLCQQRPVSRVEGLLEAAIKDMRQALALSLHQVLQQALRLERQLEAVHGIKASGSQIGTC